MFLKMALSSSGVLSLEGSQQSLPDSLLVTPSGPQLLNTVPSEAGRENGPVNGPERAESMVREVEKLSC